MLICNSCRKEIGSFSTFKIEKKSYNAFFELSCEMQIFITDSIPGNKGNKELEEFLFSCGNLFCLVFCRDCTIIKDIIK